MGMTVWRWSGAVGLGCMGVAAFLLPFPATPLDQRSSAVAAPLAAEIDKLSAAASEAQAAVRAYRATQALDRWTAATRNADTTLIRIDHTIPDSVAAGIRDVVDERWASLQTATSAAHAEVFVYLDSTSIARAGDASAARGLLEPRALVDVAFALPPATDGHRCVSLVRLRGLAPAHIGALRGQSLIGVCGFFAAFGPPGPGVQAWLTATGYRFARGSDWSVARAPATDASSLYGLSEPAGRCLTGDPTGCLSALEIGHASDVSHGPPPRRLDWVLGSAMPGSDELTSATPRSLGSAEGDFLADAVRSVGTARFGGLWGSSARLDSAFVAAAGGGLETWTAHWLAQTYGAAPERPSARLRDVVWLALVIPIALFVAARPRQRVLTERLFRSRT